MSFLKCIVQMLQVLTIAIGINSFLFDKQRRIFKRSSILKRIHSWAFKILMAPILGGALFILVLFSGIYVVSILTGDPSKGTDVIASYYVLAIIIVLLLKIGLTLYVVYLYKYRIETVRALLNDFVRLYDDYLTLFGNKLSVNWTICGILFVRLISIDIYLFAIYLDDLSYEKWFVIGLTLPPLALSVACMVGVVLLQAFYSNSNFSERRSHGELWLSQLKSIKMKKLLNFYGDLMKLRLHLEKLVNLVFIVELVMDVIYITFGVHGYIARDVYVALLLIAVSLVFPICFTELLEEISLKQKLLGNELILMSHKLSMKSEKLVQLFSLNKLLIDNGSGSFGDVLHIRRPFVLTFMVTGWINGMFLNSILLVTDTYKAVIYKT